MPDRCTERRKLPAEVDQRIEEMESLLYDPALDEDERRFAAAQLAIRRNAVEQVEKLLTNQ